MRTVLVVFGIVNDVTGFLLLRHVHGDVHALQQCVRIRSMLGVDGNADAGLDIKLQSFQTKRGLKGLADLAGNLCRILDHQDLGQQDRKLIAAQSGDGSRFLHDPLQTSCDLLQQAITIEVPECIVDFLKAIQIHHQDRRMHSIMLGGV